MKRLKLVTSYYEPCEARPCVYSSVFGGCVSDRWGSASPSGHTFRARKIYVTRYAFLTQPILEKSCNYKIIEPVHAPLSSVNEICEDSIGLNYFKILRFKKIVISSSVFKTLAKLYKKLTTPVAWTIYNAKERNVAMNSWSDCTLVFNFPSHLEVAIVR